MSIETNLRTLLLTQSSITTLVPAQTVGGTSYPSIYNERQVQGASRPYIVISHIARDSLLSLGTTHGAAKTNIDIDCYANTLLAADAIGEAVKTFIQDYSGAAGTGTIMAVELQDMQHDMIEEKQGRDVVEHIVSLNVDIFHR